MQVYIAIKYHPDGRNRARIEMLSKALEDEGWTTVCVFRDVENWGQIHLTPDVLMKKSFQLIDSSNCILIDLSEKGVGIGIEAGYAFSRNIRIVTVAEQGSDISTTLRGISARVFEYQNEDELGKFLADL